MLLFLLLAVLIGGTGCNDCKDSEDMGACLARCDSLWVPESIQSDDSLSILVVAEVADAYKLKLDHLELTREGGRLELRVWARAWRWLGECGTVMPPTANWINLEIVEPPPWPGDSIQVIVHQPEAPPVERWVRVLR
jgi:hypothetical protein